MTNPLLERHNLPPFSKISADQVGPAVHELLKTSREGIEALKVSSVVRRSKGASREFGKHMPRIFRPAPIALSCCFLIASLTASADPLHMIDVFGRAVETNDRPLFISTHYDFLNFISAQKRTTLWQRVSRKNFNKELTKLRNSVGFLNVQITQPDWYEQSFTKEVELDSVVKSKMFESLLAPAEGDLAYNGRVILGIHGSDDKEGLVGKHGIELDDMFINRDPKEVGENFGRFMKKTHLKVKQIDLFTCNGHKSIDGFVEGLEAQGISDVKVRAFKGTLAVGTADLGIDPFGPHTEEYVITFRGLKDEPTGEYVKFTDFVLKGKTGNLKESSIVQRVLGKPGSVDPFSEWVMVPGPCK